MSTHKKLNKIEATKQEHYKDCTFNPKPLKESQTIAEKKYKEDLDKFSNDLKKLDQSRA